jgi:hypothetical protein
MSHKLSRLAFLTITALLFGRVMVAQISAVGGVVRGQDGAPISGAVIRIDRVDIDGRYQTKTDMRGHWFYNGLPLGTYRVTCKVNGKNLDAVEVRTQLGDPIQVDFDLAATAKKAGRPQNSPDRSPGLGSVYVDAQNAAAPAPAPAAPLKLPATYVSAQASADQLQLNADNTFSLQEAGQSYSGTFAANGSALRLNISGGPETTATIQGSNLTDSSGQTWVLREQPAQAASGAGVLQNQDIIKMAKVGIDDATIIAKIGSSKCQFDTSTDALIQLKQSGVSPAVLKAVVAAGK